MRDSELTMHNNENCNYCSLFSRSDFSRAYNVVYSNRKRRDKKPLFSQTTEKKRNKLNRWESRNYKSKIFFRKFNTIAQNWVHITVQRVEKFSQKRL